MAPPDFKKFKEVQENMNEFENYWLLYEQFQDGLNQITKQDWITYR